MIIKGLCNNNNTIITCLAHSTLWSPCCLFCDIQNSVTFAFTGRDLDNLSRSSTVFENKTTQVCILQSQWSNLLEMQFSILLTSNHLALKWKAVELRSHFISIQDHSDCYYGQNRFESSFQMIRFK